METLEELIRRRKDELGLSFRKLGELARQAGAPTEPNWSHLANKKIQEFPKVRTIHALAAALEVQPAEIVLAAAASLDMSPNEIVRAAAACLDAGSPMEIVLATATTLGVEVRFLESPPGSGERWMVVSAEQLHPEDEATIQKGITDTAGEARERKTSS